MAGTINVTEINRTVNNNSMHMLTPILDIFNILEVSETVLRVKVSKSGVRVYEGKRIMKVIELFLAGRNYTAIAKKLNFNCAKTIKNDIQKFHEICQLYPEHKEIRRMFKVLGYNSQQQLLLIQNEVLKEENKRKNGKQIQDIEKHIEDILSGKTSVRGVAKNLNVHKDYLEKQIKLHSGSIAKIKDKAFENRSVPVERVIKAANLFINSDYFKNYERIGGILGKHRTTIQRDISKRLLLILMTYKEDTRIQDELKLQNINSYHELEALCEEVGEALLEKEKNSNNTGKLSIRIRNELTLKIADYILENRDRKVTIKEASEKFSDENFTITERTVSKYIKGFTLFLLDKEKYKEIYTIYGEMYNYNSFKK